MSLSIADIINENSKASLSLFSNKGFTVREIQICSCCKGEAFIAVTEDMGHSTGLVTEELECQNCKGTGRIEVLVTVVRKPYKPKKND